MGRGRINRSERGDRKEVRRPQHRSSKVLLSCGGANEEEGEEMSGKEQPGEKKEGPKQNVVVVDADRLVVSQRASRSQAVPRHRWATTSDGK